MEKGIKNSRFAEAPSKHAQAQQCEHAHLPFAAASFSPTTLFLASLLSFSTGGSEATRCSLSFRSLDKSTFRFADDDNANPLPPVEDEEEEDENDFVAAATSASNAEAFRPNSTPDEGAPPALAAPSLAAAAALDCETGAHFSIFSGRNVSQAPRGANEISLSPVCIMMAYRALIPSTPSPEPAVDDEEEEVLFLLPPVAAAAAEEELSLIKPSRRPRS